MPTLARLKEEDPRALAASILTEVRCQGRSLTGLLSERLPVLGSDRDRALVQEFCYGVLRWQPRLEALLTRLLNRPIKRRDAELEDLLLVGLYQILYMRIPDHAAVSETVAATNRLDRPWARGLVNATLRAFIRRRATLLAEIDAVEEARHAHPAWFIALVRKEWPGRWQDILAALNERPPMTLRVDLSRLSRNDYLERLERAEIMARAHACVESAIVLAEPVPVERLPGFAAGLASVQDAAAQLAARLLAPSGNERVLDACAAPGGKTGHLLEIAPDCALTAIDIVPERLQTVGDNLRRLRRRARLVVADVARPEDWWDGQPFDRILLDAPCSATGVIRRHPDIKLLRRPTDLDRLVETQGRLLVALAALLRPGGRLVYATCSILRQENEDRIAAFLASHEDFAALPLDGIGVGVGTGAGRQILPGEMAMDGFYYACLEKR